MNTIPVINLKAQEFQLKRDIPDYKKTQADDLKNMQTGLFGAKGHVHFQVAPCINGELTKLDRSLPKPGVILRNCCTHRPEYSCELSFVSR